MIDKEELKSKIMKDGFPLEVQVYTKLLGQSTSVISQDIYVDPDEEKVRNIDLVAQLNEWLHYSREKPLNFFLHQFLVIECKKTTSNTVFFPLKQNRSIYSGQVYSSLVNQGRVSPMDEVAISNPLHYGNRESIASLYYEEKGKPIYTAIMQLMKYINYSSTRFRRHDAVSDLLWKQSVYIWFPIILIDGKIWTAFIDNKGNIEKLEEQKHVVLNASYSMSNDIHYYNIDVITLDQFDQLINEIRNDIDIINEYLISNKERLYNNYQHKIQIGDY